MYDFDYFDEFIYCISRADIIPTNKETAPAIIQDLFKEGTDVASEYWPNENIYFLGCHLSEDEDTKYIIYKEGCFTLTDIFTTNNNFELTYSNNFLDYWLYLKMKY